MPKKIFPPLFFTILFSLAFYLIYLIIAYPLIGIKVVPIKENICKVIEVYPYGWAKHHNIYLNDILQCEKEAGTTDFKIEKTNKIYIYKSNELVEKDISYKGLPINILFLQYIHIVYFCIIFIIAIILYRNNVYNPQNRIIAFLISIIGLSYLSSGVSTRGDILAILINTFTLWLIPIMLIDYFNTLISNNRKHLDTKYIYILILPIVITDMFFMGGELSIPIFLLLFFLLTLYFFSKYSLIKKNVQFIKLKMLFWTIIISLLPFIFLSAIPNYIFYKPLISFEYTALFLLLIPVLFVYISVQRVIYDFEYLLKKLLLNFLLSLTVVFVFSIFLYMKINDGLVIFQFFLISILLIVLLLFIKDFFFTSIYKTHKKIHDSFTKFSQNTNHIKDSYDLFSYVTKEIKSVLRLTYVKYVKYHYSNGYFCAHDFVSDRTLQQLHKKLCQYKIQIGELVIIDEGYALLMGRNEIGFDIILLPFKRNTTKFNNEEIEWLTTVAIYTNLLLENLKKTEELLTEVYNDALNNRSTTVSRLLILLGDKERSKLAQDIHDSILQELIFLYKKIEYLQSEDDISPETIELVKHRLNDQISFIREACYDLNPPFLKEIGLVDSLSILLNKYTEAGDFEIFFQVDREDLYSSINQEVIVSIYRIVQELMVNAKKHSCAKCIFISLRLIEEKLILLYEDDGVGFDSYTFLNNKNHFGLSSMQERIKSINGQLSINSEVNQGTIIKVIIDITKLKD